MTTPRASQSALQNLMAFDTCTLRIARQNASGTTTLVKEIRAQEGYYQISSNTIVLRGIQGQAFREAEIDLTDGLLHAF